MSKQQKLSDWSGRRIEAHSRVVSPFEMSHVFGTATENGLQLVGGSLLLTVNIDGTLSSLPLDFEEWAVYAPDDPELASYWYNAYDFTDAL